MGNMCAENTQVLRYSEIATHIAWEFAGVRTCALFSGLIQQEEGGHKGHLVTKSIEMHLYTSNAHTFSTSLTMSFSLAQSLTQIGIA